MDQVQVQDQVQDAATLFLPTRPTRTEAASFLTALGHHILDNDLTLVDVDGEMTKYGALDGGQDDGTERTGCDYLPPYWMGRYYGFIDAAW